MYLVVEPGNQQIPSSQHLLVLIMIINNDLVGAAFLAAGLRCGGGLGGNVDGIPMRGRHGYGNGLLLLQLPTKDLDGDRLLSRQKGFYGLFVRALRNVSSVYL